MKADFQIVPGVAELFRQYGVDTAQIWLNDPPGFPANDKPEGVEFERHSLAADGKHDVWIVKLGEERYYLKRRWDEPRDSLLRMLFFGRKPVSAPVREVILAESLKKAGFAVMEPVAWGEWRQRGLPLRGFVLSKEILGSPVEVIHAEGDKDSRRQLLYRMGRLTGRLHTAGFFQHVRLKDLIESELGELVIIDREAAKPWKRKFSRAAAMTALARTLRRTMRDGHRLGQGEAGAFFRGYCEEAQESFGGTPREIRSSVLRRIRQEFQR